MAKVLILGGGFAGVVAAESLSQQLDEEHEITLVSRGRRFVFYRWYAWPFASVSPTTFRLISANRC